MHRLTLPALAVMIPLVLAGCQTASGGGGLLSAARGHMGQTALDLGLPRSNWCADFMNLLLDRKGASRQAASYRAYGTPAERGCTDCIAVIAPRSRGGHWHVGVVSGYDEAGNPVIVSGNHNHRVDEGVYPRHSVVAYRNP